MAISQSSAIAGGLIVAFVVYVTVRGQLPCYFQVLGISTAGGASCPSNVSGIPNAAQTGTPIPNLGSGSGSGGGGGTTIINTGGGFPGGGGGGYDPCQANPFSCACDYSYCFGSGDGSYS